MTAFALVSEVCDLPRTPDNPELLRRAQKYTETTDVGYQEIIRRIQADGSTRAGTYSHRDENRENELVVYKYLKDRGWVFMVRDSAAEVYSSVMEVRLIVGALCAVMAAIIFITLLILRREGRELMVVERAIGWLGDLNLSADREDEIGVIAQTTHRVCGCLRETIDNVGRILGEMADGNLSVDVTKNESYYLGDFLALSQGALEQATSIDGPVSNVTAITPKIQTSAVRCGNASELVDKATGYAAEADTKMERLTAAARNIDRSSNQIGTIIKTIEDIASRPTFWPSTRR